jgi:hypothetical protein
VQRTNQPAPDARLPLSDRLAGSKSATKRAPVRALSSCLNELSAIHTVLKDAKATAENP